MSFANRTAKGLLDSLFGKTSVFGALASAPTIHVALYDALSGGNFLGSGALGTSKAVATNDTPEFAAGEFDITLD